MSTPSSELSDTSVNGKRLTWREKCERLEAEIKRLRPFALMVSDLDRNEHGRHEGDTDCSDPTGTSQGNPNFTTGQVVGYSIAGTRRPYVMPPPGLRGDASAWVSAQGPTS